MGFSLSEHIQIPRELKVEKLGLQYKKPLDFVIPLTGQKHIVYVIYRILVALYFSIVFVYSIATFQYAGYKWIIVVTNWAFCVLLLNVLLQAYIATYYYIREVRSSKSSKFEKMTFKTKAVWVANNLTLTLAPVVTIVYWGTVYNGDTFDLDLSNITTHALNMVYVCFDFVFSALPVRLLHVTHILIFSLIYTIFTVIYWQAGGMNNHDKHYIYEIMDYKDEPSKAAMWVILLHLIVIVIHAVWFILYKLKLYVYKTYGFSQSAPQKSESTVKFPDLSMTESNPKLTVETKY